MTNVQRINQYRDCSHKEAIEAIQSRIIYRTRQAYALEKYATTDVDKEMAKQLWQEVDELRCILRRVKGGEE